MLCPRHSILMDQQNRCPVCDDPSVRFPLFPVNLYVSNRGLKWLGLCILASTFAIGGGLFGYPAVCGCAASCEQANHERQACIASMPREWHTFYLVLDEATIGNRDKVAKNTSFAGFPPLSPEQAKIILNKFASGDIDEVSAKLVPAFNGQGK